MRGWYDSYKPDTWLVINRHAFPLLRGALALALQILLKYIAIGIFIRRK